MTYDDNEELTLQTAIRAYLKDVLECDPDDVDSYDSDELWGELLDWIGWLTGRLASQECKIERLESVIFDEDDEDGLDEELDDLDEATQSEEDDAEAGYGNLDCEADE